MKKYIFIFCTFLPLALLGQNKTELSEATREEFDVSRAQEIKLVKSNKIVKKDNTIFIKPKKGLPVMFVDDLSDEGYQVSEYAGDLIKDKVVLIRTQDHNSEWYVVVNLLSGEQKIFAGFPHVYHEYIVCLQGKETGRIQEIEFWRMQGAELTKIRSFNLGNGIHPVDIAWKNENEVLIKDSTDKFWRMKAESK